MSMFFGHSFPCNLLFYLSRLGFCLGFLIYIPFLISWIQIHSIKWNYWKPRFCGGETSLFFFQLECPSAHVGHSEWEVTTRLNLLLYMCWHWSSLSHPGPHFTSTSPRPLARLAVQLSSLTHASLEAPVCFEADFTWDQEAVILVGDWHETHTHTDTHDPHPPKKDKVH